MKAALALGLLVGSVLVAAAATSIDSVSKYAYGADIGWISSESNGATRVDLTIGKLAGAVYCVEAIRPVAP